MAPGEPLWLPEDRAKVLAYRAEKALRCGRCGTAEWEWDENPDAYEPLALGCIGCMKMDAVRDELHDKAAQVMLVKPEVAMHRRRLPRRRPIRRRGR